VITRDLATNPVPHLDEMRFTSFLTKAEERTAEQRAIIDYSESLIDDFREAQVIVLGLPPDLKDGSLAGAGEKLEQLLV